MAANGKGNGKKQDRDDAAPPAPDDKARHGNGKAKDVRVTARAEAGEAGEPGEPGEPTEAKGKATGRVEAEGAGGAGATAGAEHASAGGAAEGEGEGAEGAAAGEPAPGASAASAEAPRAGGAREELRGAAWAHPIARFEQAWTRLEARLLTLVLVWLILSLVAWVFLNGLCESVTATAGTVFRSVLLSIALGWGAYRLTRGHGEEQRRNLTLLGIAAGIGLVVLSRRAAAGGGAALAFDHAVVGYFDNIKGWLQDGSTLALLGGLRGLATRLTLWLALLGGSLATASGKHIHVDVVFRFLPKGSRMPLAVINYLFAAAVCFAAVWGFFDHIAITSFGSNLDDKAGAKIESALHHVGNHAFFTRKQIGLDLRSLPHVLRGERYDQWMSAAAWNEWVEGAGFEDHFDPAKVKNLAIKEGTHPPFVVSPDGETTRGALVHSLGLVFPFGLLAIGLRFLLRALLTLSGHFEADPDEAHKEEIGGGVAEREGGA